MNKAYRDDHPTEYRERKFILACRIFQRSQASIALLKREFKLKDILKRNRESHNKNRMDNSFITEPNQGDLTFLSSGAFSESAFDEEDDSIRGGDSEISLLDSSTIMPSILVDEKENTSKVAGAINEMREFLKEAIINLEIP